METGITIGVTVISIVSFIVLVQVLRLIGKKIGESDISKKYHLLEYFEKFTETVVIKIQQEYTDKDGKFKHDVVKGQLKTYFGDIIKTLNLTDEQLDIIIKRVYEYLRSQNFGGRFIIYEEKE